MRCIKCQREIPDNAGFCTSCGQRIPRCPTCNTLLTSRAKFCTKDGARIPEEILELIPDVPAAPAAPKQQFCIRCGKPCRAGQKLCDACLGQDTPPAKSPKKTKKQKKSKKGLLIVLLILLLLLGLCVGGYFALDSGLIDPPSWMENRDDEEDWRDDEEDEEEEAEEDGEEADSRDEAVTETAAPAVDAPAAEAPMEVPATESPVIDAPVIDAPVEAPAEPAPTEAPALAISANVGDIITFGSFEQDNDSSNGQEPIEWIVLQVDGDRALVISKMLLACIPYHESNVNVTWTTCYARGWLNDTFYNAAFTPREQAVILTTTDSYGILNDKVFLPSVDEVLQFFPAKADRICRATKYTLSFDPYVNSSTKGSWWLLRTPGSDQKHVASVNSDGVMDYDGGPVASRSGTVRPAMWIRIG